MRTFAAPVVLALGVLLAVTGCTSAASSGSGTTTVTVTTSGGSSTTAKSSSSAPDTRCHTNELSLSKVSSDAGAGNVYTTFALKVTGTRNCTISGYPGFAWLNAAGAVIGAPATRDTAVAPVAVALAPGGSATFVVHDTNPGFVASCASNAPVAFAQVYPPDETELIKIAVTGSTCNPSVGPVKAS